MLYETLGALVLGIDVDFCQALGATFGVLGVLAVWLGGGAEADGQRKILEHIENSLRLLGEIVDFDKARRKASTTLSDSDGVQTLSNDDPTVVATLTDSSDKDENDKRRQDKDPQEVKQGVEPDSSVGERKARPGAPSVNEIDFWREDYWNFDLDVENDLFASAEEEPDDSWKESLDEESTDESDDGTDEEEEELNAGRGNANYSGAFFRNRNYPADVVDRDDTKSEDDSPDAPRRWRRKKKAESSKQDASSSGDDMSSSDVSPREIYENVLTDDEFDALFNSDVSPISYDGEDDDNDGEAIWSYGLDLDYLTDGSVPLDEKLDYLRERLKNGDEESREELTRLLIQRAAVAEPTEVEQALAALDEAEALIKDRPVSDESESFLDEFEELRLQALLQRPVVYLRNNMTPPMEMANDALNQVRRWVGEETNSEALRLLATAWQTHGNCLLRSGGDVAALSSFEEARDILVRLVEDGVDEAEPYVGFVSASIGEAYMAIGDMAQATQAYNAALETFGKYSDNEAFLAEKVNILFRLSVALQRLGDAPKSEKALQDAIDSEERLLSFDEEVYFAPLTQLLETQADRLASRGAWEDALASLDRAISTLQRYLDCDSSLSRRVLAYAYIENALRRRASYYIMARRFELAANDIEASLEYLALATKKGENFDPALQIAITSSLTFDLCAMNGFWAQGAKAQALFQRFYEDLTLEVRKKVAPLYGQLALRRHMLLSQSERFRDAYKINDELVGMLEDLGCDSDGEPEGRLVLAKALAQRGCFRLRGRSKTQIALEDLRRSKNLFNAEGGFYSFDEASQQFYFDLIVQKAAAETRSGFLDYAHEDLKEAICIVVAALGRQKWERLDNVALVASVSIMWAVAKYGAHCGVRVTCLWYRYVRLVRRSYIESNLNLDEQGELSFASNLFLEKIELLLVDIRRARANILEDCEWVPSLSQYCESVGSQSKKEESFFKRAVATITERIENNVIVTEEDESSCFMEKDAVRHIQANFVRGLDLKTQACWCDYKRCLQVVLHRVNAGAEALSSALLMFLNKTNEIYVKNGKTALAVIETINACSSFNDEFKRRQDENVPPSENSSFWSNAFPFFVLQGELFGNFVKEVMKDVNNSLQGQYLQYALVVDANNRANWGYLHAIEAAKNLSETNLKAPFQYSSTVRAYFIWLGQTIGAKGAIDFVNKEEKNLEKWAKTNTLIDLIKREGFYGAVASAALDVLHERAFAKETLLKLVDVLNEQHKALGDHINLLDRLGAAYERLTLISYLDGDYEKEEEYAVLALRSFSKHIFEGRIQDESFNRFANLLVRSFEKESSDDPRSPSRYFHRLERTFVKWNRKTRQTYLHSFCRVATSAARYFERRRCYYETKRIYRLVDNLIDEFRKDTSQFEELFDSKVAEGNFWSQQGDWSMALKAYRFAISLRTEQIAKLKEVASVQKEIGKAYDVLMLTFQRQIVGTQVLEATTLWLLDESNAHDLIDRTIVALEDLPEVKEALEKGALSDSSRTFLTRLTLDLIGKCKKIFEHKVPQMDPETKTDLSTEQAVQEPSSDEERQERSMSEETEQLLNAYFILKFLASLRDTDEKGARHSWGAFRKVEREVLRVLGKRNSCVLYGCYYWADRAFRNREWTSAIQFASRIVGINVNIESFKRLMDSSVPYYVDALKIRADALLERRRIGDLFRAELDLKTARSVVDFTLSDKRFYMRFIHAELLFVQAKYDLIRKDLTSARCKATQAKRLVDVLTDRGLGDPLRGVSDKIVLFLKQIDSGSQSSASIMKSNVKDEGNNQ